MSPMPTIIVENARPRKANIGPMHYYFAVTPDGSGLVDALRQSVVGATPASPGHGRVLHLASGSVMQRRRHRSGLSHPYGAVAISWPLSYRPQAEVLLQPQNFPSPAWSQNGPDWPVRHIVVQG